MDIPYVRSKSLLEHSPNTVDPENGGLSVVMLTLLPSSALYFQLRSCMMVIPRSPELELQQNAVESSPPTATQDIRSDPYDLGDEHSDGVFLSSPWGVEEDFSWIPPMPMSDYQESTTVTTQYPDTSCQYTGGSDDYLAHTRPLSDTVGSSPDPSGTSSGSSPRDVPASPDYFAAEPPIATDMPHSYFLPGQYSDPPLYLPSNPCHQEVYTQYLDKSLMTSTYFRSAQESDSSQPRLHWDVPPTPSYSMLPSISQSRRTGVPQARLTSQSQSQQFATVSGVRQFPTIEELRHWPQVFNREMNVTSKKTILACLFCRERKIGCVRPAEDEPDQTCNQCLRRQKICEYPKESHRGHHTRRRRSIKPRVSPVVPRALPAPL
ncbi:hypothetical protein DFH06DRAFT_1324138 [Mycena polygramma]|nr:hypothetical protein DFH06DRAFT_1324138 [Mycena polygramma]